MHIIFHELLLIFEKIKIHMGKNINVVQKSVIFYNFSFISLYFEKKNILTKVPAFHKILDI